MAHGTEGFQIFNTLSYKDSFDDGDSEQQTIKSRDAHPHATDCIFICRKEYSPDGPLPNWKSSLMRCRVLDGETGMEAAIRMALAWENQENHDDWEVREIGERAFSVKERTPAENLARSEREEFEWMFGATLPEQEIARPRPGL